ncbi:MAG: PorT family protein [Bacteroidota bacterium]|nr:PorT family protein [Bacteroidota bacterium]
MKKLLSIIILAGFITKANSQTYLQGGTNLANITETSSGQTQRNNLLTTFNVGILGRFDLSKIVDLESGLLFEGRGAKANTYFTSSLEDNYVKSRFNPLYLEVPLNLVIKIPFQKHMNIFFNAGPYAAMGIAGKAKSETRIFGATSTSTSNIKFSNDDPFTSKQDDAAYDKIKRFDFGLNLGGGLDLGKVLLKVNYGYGFTKINSTQSDNGSDNKNKYRTLSVSLGIPLNG